MIQVKQLAKRYGAQEILHGLSFSAYPSQITLFLGENGVGKTTTLRILSGLMRPDSGDACISGHSIVRDRSDAQRLLSYLPQGTAFHPKLSCEAVLRFYAELRGVPFRKGNAGDRARRPLRGSSQAEWSALRGLRQRLGLGVLLLADAPVLLLDEPGLSLDPEWRSQLQTILQEEASSGKTVLVTTHLLAEWEGAAHRALLCQKGGAVTEIDPHRLRDEFLHKDAGPAAATSRTPLHVQRTSSAPAPYRAPLSLTP